MSHSKSFSEIARRIPETWKLGHEETLAALPGYLGHVGETPYCSYLSVASKHVRCLPNAATRFVVLHDRQFRGIQLQVSAARARMVHQAHLEAELDAARRARAEAESLAAEAMKVIGEAKQLLGSMQTRTILVERASETQIAAAADLVEKAAAEVFGADKVVSVQVEPVLDGLIEEVGASHRVQVAVRLPEDNDPRTLATAERDFFQAAAVLLPEEVSSTVQLILRFT